MPGRLAMYMLVLLLLASAAGRAQPPVGPLSAGAPLFYCAGNDVPFQPIVPPTEKRYSPDEVKQVVARRCAAAKREGMTSLEVYVKWWICEPQPGQWDFSYYDIWQEGVRAAGLKWVAVVIAGSSWATPPWFRQSDQHVGLKCLEHNHETPTQSLWNPNLRAPVTEFFAQCAMHFDHSLIETIKLGVCGDFGEALYMGGGNHWTYLGEPYHTHHGYWCGDPYARADFRAYLQRQYGTIDALNAAWRTTHDSFDKIEPFLPEAAPSRRARLDLNRWYCAAMTSYTEFWLQTLRQLFPRTRLTIAAGGDGASVGGGDFTAQAALAARYEAGMRITNEASHYLTNFSVTRQVASACRHFGAHFGMEPAGAVDAAGVAARAFNCVASGADEFFTYDPEPAGERAGLYTAVRPLLTKRDPFIDVGVLLSRTSWDLGQLGQFIPDAQTLRHIADVAYVDELLIAEGALRNLRVLFWTAGPIIEAETAAAVMAWVQAGGILVVRDLAQMETVEGDHAIAEALLPRAAFAAAEGPKRLRLDIGSEADDRVLRGPWHGRERGMGFPAADDSFRWSTVGSEVLAPVPQAEVVTIVVHLAATGARAGEQTILADGEEVYRSPGAGEQRARIVLRGVMADTVRLTFGGPAWPATPPDTRQLGVAVASVTVAAGEWPTQVLDSASPHGFVPGLSVERIARDYTRRVGAGVVVYLPACNVPLPALAREVVDRSARFLPGARVPYPLLEGDYGWIFLTRCLDGSILLLSMAKEPRKVRYAGAEITVPPLSFIEHRQRSPSSRARRSRSS